MGAHCQFQRFKRSFDLDMKNKNQYPWIVHMETASGPLCGGTVLNSRYVLTAAHCTFHPGFTQPRIASEIKVFVGAHNLDMMELDGVQEVGVSSYVNHPGFKPHDNSWIRGDYDYSILELMRDIVLPTITVREACLSILP